MSRFVGPMNSGKKNLLFAKNSCQLTWITVANKDNVIFPRIKKAVLWRIMQNGLTRPRQHINRSIRIQHFISRHHFSGGSKNKICSNSVSTKRIEMIRVL